MIKGLDDPIVRQKAKKVGKVDAPQVGIPLRVAVVEVDKKLFTLVNPEIIERSKETQHGPEGCLSIPGYWADVERAMKVRVRALDRNGKRFTTTGEGFLARAFQHEIDHLDGILYIDRLPSLDLLRRVEELDEEEETATV